MRQLMVFYFHTFFRFSIRAPHSGKKGVTRVQGGHGFHHHHSSGYDDGIMAALDPDLDVLFILVDGILRRGDGGSGLI